MNTEEKKELAKKLNISLKTYYNWEKEKPYLIKLIELGIQKEKEIENENGEDILVTLKRMEERLEKLESK